MKNLHLSKLRDPQRLRALQDTSLLDTPAEESFDRIGKLAAELLHVPVALVTLVDENRQFFKSCIGLPQPWATARETPLSHSFCQYVTTSNEPLIVEDARRHPRLSTNQAVEDLDVIAYLGMPLITSNGFNLGSFCVIDQEPREWTPRDIQLLRELSYSVITEIELRIQVRHQEQVEKEITLMLKISRMLNSSLEMSSLLPQIAEQIVPQLADWTVLYLPNFMDGKTHTGIAHHRGPAAAATIAQVGKDVRRLADDHPLKAQLFFAEDAQIGEPGILEEILANLESSQQRTLLQLGAHAFIRVPILLQGEQIGQILLVFGASERDYKARNLLLAEELAQMIAMTAQNARLYKQAQNALVRRDEFMQIAAHEVKNPITAVRLGAEVLQRQLSAQLQQGDARESYDGLMQEIKRLERLVHDLFDVSLVDVGQLAVALRVVDLTDVAARTVREMGMLAPSHRFHLQAVSGSPMILVMGDEMRLEQVCYNLLRNAVKYSDDGTDVRVSLSICDNMAVFSVKDKGIGIGATQIPRLFDRSYRVNPASQTTKPGLGVGLYLVSEIVRRHNGRIEVTSDVGEGSTFTVYLPLAPASS